MAESVSYSETEQPDDDVLPDNVEKADSGIKVYQFLDEGNLVEKVDDLVGGRQQVVSDTKALLDEAKNSMEKWRKHYEQALKLAKLEPEAKEKTFPFQGASQVMLPFIMEAMLDFHSRTVPELVWADNVVGIKTYGEPSEEKTARAERTSDFMNYQISELIPYWRPEQDKMLLALPCVGTAYKETRFNGDRQEADSQLRLADEVIFSHDYSTFDEAPDKFIEEEFTRNEILMYIRGAEEWDLDEDEIPQLRDHPKPHEFIRAFTWIDLDQDGMTEPYEVIIRRENDHLVAVFPAYDEEGILTNDDGEIVEVKMDKVFTQYQFIPDPEGGPMGMGWGILLGDMFEGINTSMRQLLDAGTLSNLAANSGLIDYQLGSLSSRGNRQQSGPVEVSLGKLTPITTGGKSLRESIVQFPFAGPNATLFSLLEWMVEQVRNMSNSALNMDTNGQEAAVMYLARLQQGLKIPNSIVMRVYNAAKREFKRIADINFKHYDNEKYNRVLDDADQANMRNDFNPEDCDIRLAVDPSQGTDIERMNRAQLILQEAKDQLQLGVQQLNMRQVVLDWLDAMKAPNVDQLAPEPSGEPSPQEQMIMANMQRQAELEERDMRLKEAKQDMERAEMMLKGHREAVSMGLDLDRTEAEIVEIYSRAMKALWETGMAGDDPIGKVQTIESRLIDQAPTVPALEQPIEPSIEPADPNAAPVANAEPA